MAKKYIFINLRMLKMIDLLINMRLQESYQDQAFKVMSIVEFRIVTPKKFTYRC